MNEASHAESAPKWQPLPPAQRRVLGVLVEKAKTTPSGYPLSLNAVVVGSNQKSNRDPQMELDAEDVEDALTALRECGAVGEVHGDGRVPKYRHYMKDWLGVDGTELAVMAELLLRGPQTIGDLRGRAARMAGNALPDVGALRPVVQSLMAKGLVLALTPEGRGQMVTHALFPERELREIKAEFAGGRTSDSPHPSPVPSAEPAVKRADAPRPETPKPQAGSTAVTADLASLSAQVEQLQQEVARMRKEIEDIWSNLS